jgi:hypothetical protein
MVLTGPDIGQWQLSGTKITSLWLDLENDLNVTVQSGYLTKEPDRGELNLGIVNQNTKVSGTIHGIDSQSIETPKFVGPLTITEVTGSLADEDMLIHFSCNGGTGRYDPQTKQLSDSCHA